MVHFNLINLLSGFRRHERKIPEKRSIGDVVTFHDGSYATIVSWDEYVKDPNDRSRSRPPEPVRKGIETGEWYCIKTIDGTYLIIPSSALHKVEDYK